MDASKLPTFSLRCKLSELKQNISFLKFFLMNSHRGLANFTQFCKAGLAIKSIPAVKSLLFSEHYEPISNSHSRHDYQRRK
jgi:hypothetical protein